MWKDSLEEIRRRREKRGKLLNIGASKEQLESFQKEVKIKFHYDLPEEYMDFLAIVNGMEYNGLVLYGIDDSITNQENNQVITGYIDTNEIWYENEEQQKYMFFGDENISWYCLDIERNIYVELDKPSGSLEQEFKKFNDMIDFALENSL